MKASTLINILSHLPADMEIVLGEVESAILAEFRRLVPAHVADKVTPSKSVETPDKVTPVETPK